MSTTTAPAPLTNSSLPRAPKLRVAELPADSPSASDWLSPIIELKPSSKPEMPNNVPVIWLNDSALPCLGDGLGLWSRLTKPPEQPDAPVINTNYLQVPSVDSRGRKIATRLKPSQKIEAAPPKVIALDDSDALERLRSFPTISPGEGSTEGLKEDVLDNSAPLRRNRASSFSISRRKSPTHAGC
ncbi:hypothetical protein NMY22_g12321 [Coprinellus aureogranulatus]|nr:hypothetical protein NMY22_g12321 [Coprinellus aureogranulatus]